MTHQPELPFEETTSHSRIRGCLLGGAVGDALGAPVEFMSLKEIRDRFGPDGIRDFEPAYGRSGSITDDTQMTLFTAEGLLRAQCAWRIEGSATCRVLSITLTSDGSSHRESGRSETSTFAPTAGSSAYGHSIVVALQGRLVLKHFEKRRSGVFQPWRATRAKVAAL